MVWYYADGDRQRGPISDEEFQEMVNNGRIRQETLVWTDGMENWQSLDTARESGHVHIASPSPQPGPSAPSSSPTPTSTTINPLPATPAPTSTPTAPASQTGREFCSQCGRGPLGLYDGVKLGNLLLCRDCDTDLARHYQQASAGGLPPTYAGTVPPVTGATAGISLASIPARFFAKLIDQFITIIIMFIVMALTVDMGLLQQLSDAMYDSQDIDQLNKALDQLYTALRPAMLTGLIFRVLYDAILVGFFGATLGKMVFGIRVAAPDGSQVRFSQAAIRAIAPAVIQLPQIMLSSTALLSQLSGFFMMFAYLIAIFDGQKRTLFDHIAGTRVVKN